MNIFFIRFGRLYISLNSGLLKKGYKKEYLPKKKYKQRGQQKRMKGNHPIDLLYKLVWALVGKIPRPRKKKD